MRQQTKESLRNECWKMMSEYVRKFEKSCISCGETKEFIIKNGNKYPNMNAGHFIHNKLDFDYRNVHKQCVRCNKHLHGNATMYAYHLVKISGEKKFLKLVEDAIKHRNEYSMDQLIDIKKDLTRRLKKLNEAK